MGYTTSFEGKFKLSKIPSGPVIAELLALTGEKGTKASKALPPDSYCQWELTRDCLHIQWDGGEKFYNYIEWLQFIITHVLKPDGVSISGEVKFDGEEFGDQGILKIKCGKVVSEKLQLVSDDVSELVAFRNFVLKSDFAEEISSAWKNREK